MKVMTFFLSLISVTAFASLKWDDLDKGSKVSFNQEIKLATDDKDFIIPLNSKAQINDRVSLDMINVEMFKATLLDCIDKGARGDLQLIETKDVSGKIITSGVELTGNCRIEIFVELKDLYYKSLFK